MSFLNDLELLERDPRAGVADAADRVGACGHGIPQPGWPACHEQGSWWIARPSGDLYDHPYCTKHAARRVRALEQLHLAVMWRQQERRAFEAGVRHDRMNDALDLEPAGVRHG